ncbi:MAG: transketolase family protein [Fusobacterium sp.]|nr:transketolase family protein [Fusobacterium sp.]
MMSVNTKERRSIRNVFGETLAKLGETNKDIVVLDADLACSTQTQIFGKKFPDRFFDAGIAEQDMVATAAGLASAGKIPFAATFAIFATGRTYDQIRNSVAYPKLNVKIVGTHGGVTVGEDGASHQALEDVALMRSIPNMMVIVPSDCKECEEVIKFAAEYKGPMYIRLARTNLIDLFDENYKFNPYTASVLREGKDFTVISNGETLAEVIMAADILKEKGIEIEIISMPVIKPIDTNTIIKSAEKTGYVVTVENHSVINGLGSAVCEVLSEKLPTRVHRIGVHDEFGQSGKWAELMAHYGLTAEKIALQIEELRK